jgi:hypothetical protein
MAPLELLLLEMAVALVELVCPMPLLVELWNTGKAVMAVMPV